ncbi:histone deacetylase family protein [Aporhodopirellula aestuarii]|uniref:Histone deacetylase n=1 Tax=Aporhodopirellula aestuarii TaxID=2950107 RepID=A0ABT0U4F1_9BACT|nr:histone deacetylase [Aporhodopirellula aestuarii]MCM2371812.1 histone deacetylase [Aporhodopirellula aestuarii]
MTLLYYDPVFMEHQTGDHPESPKRLLPIVRHLSFLGLDVACRRPSWEPATREQLSLAHAPEHIDHVERVASSGGGWLDADTRLSNRSYEVACSATGAVCDAVTRVVADEDHTAFCLLRPPGHHATADQAMGFCLFNHVAVAARHAIHSLGIRRVLIVDFDVHHGNGTQDIFWDDASVGYFSMHRDNFWPHTGSAKETGAGAGRGTTKNVPVPMGTPRAQQREMFAREVTEFADRIKPELVIASAGFDAHVDDPVGSLGLHTEDFGDIAKTLLNVAAKHASGRLVSVLEGGYNPEALSDSITVYLETLLEV